MKMFDSRIFRVFARALAAYFLISAVTYAQDSNQSPIVQSLNPWKGDLEDMVKRGFVRVLTVHNPMMYFLDGSTQRGATYELMRLFEEELNDKFSTSWKNRISVIMIALPRDQLIHSLSAGIGDIAAANLTITPERQKQIEFSDPLLTDVTELFVTSTKSDINTLLELTGKEVYVRRSSSYYKNLQKINAELGRQGKQKMKILAANEQLEDYDLLEMVNADLIPMVVVDSHKAEFWEGIFSDIKVHRNIKVNTGGQIAWAFRKNSPQLKKVINQFIKTHKKGTLFGNIIFNRYLRTNKWVKNSLATKEQEKLYVVKNLYQKYGSQYGFDWLLIAALSYQESKHDQNKRSPAGAVGIMQILPSTAADKNVNIQSIEKVENNVHAGTKYLAFIRGRYFSDQRIDTLNQELFSIAAYNAGPASIAKLRTETAQSGLDPNKWFQNVEIIAAKRIGRETAQYVRNIFKYYIAYKTILEDKKSKRAIKQKIEDSSASQQDSL